MASPEISIVQAIIETHGARDPSGATVAVGGAALVLQMHAANLDVPATKDVDTLCSPEFFDELLTAGPRLPDISEFHTAWPSGFQRTMGATAQAVSILPDRERFPGQIRFTAATELGSPRLSLHRYTELVPEELVVVEGIRCASVVDILVRKAILGRKKDLTTVRSVLPRVLDAGLVTPEQHDRITAEYSASRAARQAGYAAGQTRYYARVAESDFHLQKL